MSQPVIIKNKIVYGYMDKATVCRDMGREDYNDLTEAQQLNGDVCFIQGVDASAFAPTNSLWNKVGTTPLDSELPSDCSNAINQLKSDLSGFHSDLNSMFIVKKQTFNNVTFPSQSLSGCWYSAAQTLSNPSGYTAVMVNLESGWGSCNGCISPYIYHNQNKVGFMKNTSGQVGNITVEVLYIDNDYITWQT